MSKTLLDLVRELNTLNDDNLADRVIENSDVQWCLSELQDILEEMPTLTPPNEPLTLEQLRQMDGKPVLYKRTNQWFIVQLNHPDFGGLTMDQNGLLKNLEFWAENCDRTNTGCQAAFVLRDAKTLIEDLSARCKRLDEARERANEAAHQWEGRCKILETRLETAEKMVKEYQDVIVPGYRERAETAESELKRMREEKLYDMPPIGGFHDY